MVRNVTEPDTLADYVRVAEESELQVMPPTICLPRDESRVRHPMPPVDTSPEMPGIFMGDSPTGISVEFADQGLLNVHSPYFSF